MNNIKKVFAFALGALIAGSAEAVLAPGDLPPDFVLSNQDGSSVKLASLKGRPVLLYFYPKDDTPGCTKQACELRDHYAKFKEKGVLIYGISRQDSVTHRKFREKYKLPFDLLSDTKGDVAKKYGVKLIPVLGFHQRQSVLIGPDQKVIKFYPSVDPATHATEVMKEIESMPPLKKPRG